MHSRFPNLRAANLSMLGSPRDKEAIATATKDWDGLELETPCSRPAAAAG